MDNRPYIYGLDDTACSNLLRKWFKYGGLAHEVNSIIHREAPENLTISDEDVRLVIDLAYDSISKQLLEYSTELETSRELNNAYIDGIKDVASIPYFEKYIKEEEEED